MAHSLTQWCTCGHNDDCHSVNSTNPCRIRGCLCGWFMLVDADEAQNPRASRRVPS